MWLNVGDVVVRINGRVVEDTADLRNSLGVLRAGADVELSVIRDGQPLLVSARVDAPVQQQFEGGKLHKLLEGLVLGNIAEDSSFYGKLDGLMIVDVVLGSYTWRAGLRKGDIITSVNRQMVSNRDQMDAALRLVKNKVLLNIRRGNSALFVLL